MRYFFLLVATYVFFCFPSLAQENGNPIHLRLTLDNVIVTAHDQSLGALVARHNFISSHWGFKTFHAQLLPSLNLSGNVADFNRSLVSLQDAQTGKINYLENYTFRNNLQLSLDQNLPFTGGRLSVYTQLDRLDQFEPNRNTVYTSQPVNIRYMQPLRTYNTLKWQKKSEPKKYEKAKREFLEAMEDVTVTAVTYYFNLLKVQQQLELAVQNYKNTTELYKIAEKRFELGTLQKSELYQLELRMLNDDMAINDARLQVNMSKLRLRVFLGLNENVEIELVLQESLPELLLDQNEVYERAMRNSSFGIGQELSILSAEQEVAKALSEKGITATFNARFGINQSAEKFKDAYRKPSDQEVFGVSLSMPILDWGLSKGKVQMAKSRENVVRSQVEQALENYRQDIINKVFQFNNQIGQCKISERANEIAEERYQMAMERFRKGTLGVTDINTAQSEKDQAASRYVGELSNFWSNYYSIRKLCLYDYFNKIDISVEFDKIIKE